MRRSASLFGLPTVRTVAAAGWRYHRHGKPEKVLQYERFRVPFNRSGSQVVVKMLAAPVHRHDRNMISGNHGPVKALGFPQVAGVEGVGVVEEVGASATLNLQEGDLVWVNNPAVGTWATHIVTEADNLDVVPNRADVDIEYLASLSLFHTAYHLTNSFVSLQPNDVVLQTGASSSVAQICQGYIRARGAKLFQTLQLGRTEHAHLVSFFKVRGAFAVVPYNYVRTNYMRRLLSDVPPPKLLLNHTCGNYASSVVNLLGDNGVCVTYGSTSGKPMQIANMDAIARGIQFKGFFLPSWIRRHTREARMRVHQNVVESMTISQGHGIFRAQRFKMDGDSPFAFSNAWDAPLGSRKPILRMVGEYGEWRRPRSDQAAWNIGRAVWDDLLQQMWESAGTTENPQSMKYYTPFKDIYSHFHDAKQTKEMGHRDVFFRRPNAPRHNAAERA
ncbi:putative nuclear receptor binding factor [Trypanosoma cruzi]|uniref:Putative nuclear receptor binding factor n=1 Tax=Trypanosoma cruzi TaxID=5693 RepID=A0A2V2WNC1_TRYCR|nr:putative nuclear receptor binding factor [Trypanosoma cruzi]